MTKSEMIWLAKLAVEKKWGFDKLKYCDYLYGKESLADDVWAFVNECEQIGKIAFNEKYSGDTT